MTKVQRGHVSATQNGNDMRFDCECGATETVTDYMSSQNSPEKFEWRVTFRTEESTCRTCGKEYEGNVGAQNW